MSFNDSPRSGVITADGDYSVSVPAGSQVVAEIAGNLGSAQVTLGFQTLSRTFKAYQLSGADVVLQDGDASAIQVTGRGEVVFRVSGLTGGATVRYSVTPVIQSGRE